MFENQQVQQHQESLHQQSLQQIPISSQNLKQAAFHSQQFQDETIQISPLLSHNQNQSFEGQQAQQQTSRQTTVSQQKPVSSRNQTRTLESQQAQQQSAPQTTVSQQTTSSQQTPVSSQNQTQPFESQQAQQQSAPQTTVSQQTTSSQQTPVSSQNQTQPFESQQAQQQSSPQTTVSQQTKSPQQTPVSSQNQTQPFESQQAQQSPRKKNILTQQSLALSQKQQIQQQKLFQNQTEAALRSQQFQQQTLQMSPLSSHNQPHPLESQQFQQQTSPQTTVSRNQTQPFESQQVQQQKSQQQKSQQTLLSSQNQVQVTEPIHFDNQDFPPSPQLPISFDSYQPSNMWQKETSITSSIFDSLLDPENNFSLSSGFWSNTLDEVSNVGDKNNIGDKNNVGGKNNVGDKRYISQLDSSSLNVKDRVTFYFQYFRTQSHEKTLGKIVQFSTEKMNKIGWLDKNDQLDNRYIPYWYPNCDLSLNIVPDSDEEDEKKNDGDFMDDVTVSYPPISNENVLKKLTKVSVVYGHTVSAPNSESVSIQENGIVMEIDSNRERNKWCKIQFERNNQHWYSWQKIENVKLDNKQVRLE